MAVKHRLKANLLDRSNLLSRTVVALLGGQLARVLFGGEKFECSCGMAFDDEEKFNEHLITSELSKERL